MMCILTDIADALHELPAGAQVELVMGCSAQHAWNARRHIALDDDRLAIIWATVSHLRPTFSK